MHGNGDSDEFTPIPTKLGHEGNLPLARALGNYVLELRQHMNSVNTFYQEVISLTRQAPAVLEEKVLIEFERHHEADAKNLSDLRAAVR